MIKKKYLKNLNCNQLKVKNKKIINKNNQNKKFKNQRRSYKKSEKTILKKI